MRAAPPPQNRAQAPLAATIALRVNIDDDDDDDRDSRSYLHRTDQQRTAAALLEATLAAPAQPSAVADRAVDGTLGRATRARVLPATQAAQAEAPAPQVLVLLRALFSKRIYLFF